VSGWAGIGICDRVAANDPLRFLSAIPLMCSWLSGAILVDGGPDCIPR